MKICDFFHVQNHQNRLKIADLQIYPKMKHMFFNLTMIPPPGDLIRDPFIPKRWRSPLKGSRLSPSQKGHQQDWQAYAIP